MKTIQCSSCGLAVDISSVPTGSGANCPGCGLNLLMGEPPPSIPKPRLIDPNRPPTFVGNTQIAFAIMIVFAAFVEARGTSRFPAMWMGLVGVLIAVTSIQIRNLLVRILHELRRQSPGPR